MPKRGEVGKSCKHRPPTRPDASWEGRHATGILQATIATALTMEHSRQGFGAYVDTVYRCS